MTFIEWFGLIIAAGLGATVALFRKGGKYNPIVPSTDHSITEIALEPPLEASKTICQMCGQPIVKPIE